MLSSVTFNFTYQLFPVHFIMKIKTLLNANTLPFSFLSIQHANNQLHLKKPTFYLTKTYNLNRVRLQHRHGVCSFLFTTMLTSSQNRKLNENCSLLPRPCFLCNRAQEALIQKVTHQKYYKNFIYHKKFMHTM